MKEPGNIQYPKDHSNDHNGIQDGLDGCLHWNEAIHEPKHNTHDDQNFHELNKRHDFNLSDFANSVAEPVTVESCPPDAPAAHTDDGHHRDWMCPLR